MGTQEGQPQDGQYKVVALKYRPQSFGDLVGQSHIATALSNAINKNRVGHAYLFTGARGVGKTSSARIFAKCLNCATGSTTNPCNECDVCDAVSAGEDVDVLEIDGASNRGIDEIRQLRSNAAVRPSRSRYKIYIIDEVHMLTMQAFNALLKTLEEPPAHVKFIFCTTDPQKIPITVLSRCQRFDFSPVQTDEIANRLREIAQSEGVTADEQALSLLARRANGSMRDSQSLLEQLFSFCGKNISVDEVNQLLGTADMGRIADVATAMANCEPKQTLNLIHQGMSEGVDAGQMADQLLGYFRDMMAIQVGCGADTLLNCTATDMEHLAALGEALGLETILTIVQLLDSAVVRMQSSLHSRTLLEAAAIRICNLEKLDSISDLVNSLSKTTPGSKGSVKASATGSRSRPKVQMQQVKYGQAATNNESKDASKKNEVSSRLDQPEKIEVKTPSAASVAAPAVSKSATPRSTTPPAATPEAQVSPAGHSSAATLDTTVAATPTVVPENPGAPPVSASDQVSVEKESTGDTVNIESLWQKLLDDMGDMTADMASDYESLVMKKPDQLEVTLADSVSKDLCSKPERKQKFETALEQLAGAKIRIDFLVSKKSRQEHAAVPRLSRVQQIRQLQELSFVKQTISLFDAEITGYQEPMPTKKR